MRREDIEDRLDIWVELQRLDAPCGVCSCITPHADLTHRTRKDNEPKEYARMCLNHCDIEIDEMLVQVSFKHKPSGKYVEAKIDKYHWGNLHGYDTNGGHSNEVWYGVSFDWHTNKNGYGRSASGPLDRKFYPDRFDEIPFDNPGALKVYLLQWAADRTMETFAHEMKLNTVQDDTEQQLSLF